MDFKRTVWAFMKVVEADLELGHEYSPVNLLNIFRKSFLNGFL